MKKVITLVGARPQFVKAAVVSKAMADHGGLQESIVHSGQHYDANMSAIFFEQLGIPAPSHSLDVGSASHGAQTAEILQKFEQILLDNPVDCVLVYGDTNTTLAGALAASKLHIPVAHVEAGLRSFNRRMPEEINRILTDSIADLLFTPSALATSHLVNEGTPRQKIVEVGDVMQDAVQLFQASAEEQDVLHELNLVGMPYVLATIHRAENTEDPQRLTAIIEALVILATSIPIVLPLHPRTAIAITAIGLLDRLQQAVRIIEPIGYFGMLLLEKHATVVVTDSGGVQKEAYFSRVPCVTIRDETEWTELVEHGWNRLAPPTSADSIAQAVFAARGTQGRGINIYGDGNASKSICDALAQLL